MMAVARPASSSRTMSRTQDTLHSVLCRADSLRSVLVLCTRATASCSSVQLWGFNFQHSNAEQRAGWPAGHRPLRLPLATLYTLTTHHINVNDRTTQHVMPMGGGPPPPDRTHRVYATPPALYDLDGIWTPRSVPVCLIAGGVERLVLAAWRSQARHQKRCRATRALKPVHPTARTPGLATHGAAPSLISSFWRPLCNTMHASKGSWLRACAAKLANPRTSE